MPTWPTSLPTAPMISGLNETLADNLVRTQMDQGPAKVRRRSTANVKPLQIQYVLTVAQKDTLITFFVTTLVSGSLSFTFTDPLTDSSSTVRFTGPPSFKAVSAIAWATTLALEVLPA